MSQKRNWIGDALRSRTLRKSALFCVVLLLGSVIALESFNPGEVADDAPPAEEDSARPVTVVTALPQTYRAAIVGYGEVKPEWQVDLQAKAQGKVVGVSDRFRVGELVPAGEILLSIDRTETDALLGESELSLREAQLELQIEERESREALVAWERAGLDQTPVSPLVLRQPYLEKAKAKVRAAEATVARARALVQDTEIKAPFEAIVVARNVSLGSELFAGNPVCTLVGAGKAVVAIHVDKRQWSLLPPHWQGMAARIVDPELRAEWQGTLVREGLSFDASTRLRALFIELRDPLKAETPLLPGNFVEVHLEGKPMDRLLQLPASARDQKGRIWMVGEDRLLQSHVVQPAFQRDGYIYVESPLEGAAVVVINPNSSFVDGLKVTPREGA